MKTFTKINFAIFILVSILFGIVSCFEVKSDNSISVKEFLYKTDYNLRIDGKFISKENYQDIECSQEIIVELLDKEGNFIKDFFLKTSDNSWTEYKEGNIKLRLVRNT